jgi:cysteine desulfuration protein SufE
MTIEQAEQQLIEEFSYFSDWMDKYNYIIELGKELPLIDPQYKTPQYLISGCQSQVWLHAEFKEGKLIFSADSDAIITKGIVNLLIKVLSNRTPEEILDAKLDFIDAIGLRAHLSPTRSNGLNAMLKQMKMYATAFMSTDLHRFTQIII